MVAQVHRICVDLSHIMKVGEFSTIIEIKKTFFFLLDHISFRIKCDRNIAQSEHHQQKIDLFYACKLKSAYNRS